MTSKHRVISEHHKRWKSDLHKGNGQFSNIYSYLFIFSPTGKFCKDLLLVYSRASGNDFDRRVGERVDGWMGWMIWLYCPFKPYFSHIEPMEE